LPVVEQGAEQQGLAHGELADQAQRDRFGGGPLQPERLLLHPVPYGPHRRIIRERLRAERGEQVLGVLAARGDLVMVVVPLGQSGSLPWTVGASVAALPGRETVK
jgi:hypothetical protein